MTLVSVCGLSVSENERRCLAQLRQQQQVQQRAAFIVVQEQQYRIPKTPVGRRSRCRLLPLLFGVFN